MAKLGVEMRLPFPERIPLPLTIIAATVLFGLQQMQGTSLAFSVYSLLFIIIANIAFNLAGGFSRPSGSYVFFYATLAVIFGLVFKAYLGEPADSNLRNPILTIQVHTGGITAMLAAVFVSRKLTRRRSILGNVLKQKDMRNATIGSIFVGTLLFLILVNVPHESGSILSALSQVNRFLPLAVVLGTIHVIRKSDGRRSVDLVLGIAIFINVLVGFIGFGKEAMFTPFFCYLFAAASMRYKFRPYQILVFIGLGFICVTFLVPYSQYGRTQVPEESNMSERFAVAASLLGNLSNVREQYSVIEKETFEAKNAGYFNSPQGFADRLSMIPVDDALIHLTEQGNIAGFKAIVGDFANWIPHFIWPDKPPGGTGNQYAREIGGIIGDEDTTTGISFSPSAQAFHLAQWFGVILFAPVIWIMLFTLFDSLCGDTRGNPWGLLIAVTFSHFAPEGMLSGAIYIMWFGTLGIVFSALTAGYVLPLIGAMIAGAEKTGLVRTRSPQPVRRRVPVEVRPSNISG